MRALILGCSSMLCIVLLGLLGPKPVDACCPAYPPGARVAIADQEVLITYDAATGREHFVRRASFTTREKGFGFLVPTPSQPKLGEADNAVFSKLRRTIKPKIEYENDYQVNPSLFLFCCLTTLSAPTDSARSKSASMPESDVRVLDYARVAGYDAVVLEAKNADALATWLSDNGYESRRELTEWVKPYVDAGWKVTAFKYAADDASGAVATKAVRLSFDTKTPLFPYRVPTDQIAKPGEGNLLRLYYVGSERAGGALGAAKTPWGAKTKFANALEDAQSILKDAVPVKDLPQGAWLTAFEDDTWPSGTEDLYFDASPDADPVIPVVIRTKKVPLLIPFDVILILAGIVFWQVRKRRKAAAEA